MTRRRSQFNQPLLKAGTLLVLSGAVSPARAEAPCDAIKRGRAALIGAVFVAADAGALLIRHDDWWIPPSRTFHVIWGGSPSKSQDGFLHASIAYQTSQLASLSWDWACADRATAGWLGAAMGLVVAIPKEIGDGFHQNGFSIPDMLWTTGGALVPALHRAWRPSRTVSLKGFYWPSLEYRNRLGPLPQPENDYAGQRYFLSLNPSRGARHHGWPRWLGVAFGHGVPYWVTLPPKNDWYLTFDLDLRGLPIRAAWWRTFSTLADQIHLPMPGLRLRNGSVQLGVF